MSSADVVTVEALPVSPAAASVLPMLLAGAIWYFEFRQRGGGVSGGLDLKPLLRSCVPEVAALVGCLLMAALLTVLRGEAAAPEDPSDLEAWNKIKEAWPLLTTADTLLALQAMLRLPLLLSAALRPSDPSGSAGPGAAVAFCAASARVCVFVFSRFHRLDGPLGGWLHIACEIAALPALLAIARGALQQPRCLLALATVLCVAGRLSWRHRLAVADDSPTLDSLFMLAELLEVATAAAFLLRTLVWTGGSKRASVTLLHLILPLQQGLSMYYFFTAFSDDYGLVGAGRPLAVLQIGGMLQVLFYLAAAAMHLAMYLEGPEE